jgi:hypothetical protein
MARLPDDQFETLVVDANDRLPPEIQKALVRGLGL